MRYIHLDDQAIAIGGTNLTSLSILESRIGDVQSISCGSLTIDFINNNLDKVWIIGNIMSLMQLNPAVADTLFSLTHFVKLEFDYNFCPYRGEVSHQVLGKCNCECPYGVTGVQQLARIYDLIIHNASHIFFMSERQRAVYSTHLPLMNFDKTSILSSCFSTESLKKMEEFRSVSKNGKYAILSGFGGWHSQAKGFEDAKSYCEINKIEYDILPIQDHHQHLASLSQYSGIVFLPIIHDTCPRCIIEARLMGLGVVTNVNSQHTTESWWGLSIEELGSYLAQRPSYFWSVVDENCSPNTN